MLECLAETPEGLGLSPLAHRVGLAVSTAHRLLRTLEIHEFVRQDHNGRLWQIGPNAYIVGSAFVAGRDLFTFARPFLRHIRDVTKESVALIVPEHLKAVTVQVAPSPQNLRAEHVIGENSYLHHSAAGLAMLSMRSAMDLSDYFGEVAHDGREGLPSSMRRKVERHLSLAREMDVVVCENAPDTGIVSIASMITDNRRAAVAAIQMTAPMMRVSDEQQASYIQLIREASRRLTYMYTGRLHN